MIWPALGAFATFCALSGAIYVFNDVLRGFFRLEKDGKGGFLAINTLGDTSLPSATRVSEGITEERCIEFVREAIGVTPRR